MINLFIYVFISLCFTFNAYDVRIIQRDKAPLLSHFVLNNSQYKQVFNPTWIHPSLGTNHRKGLLVRTQDCDVNVGDKCVFCGGSAAKASILTFSEQINQGFQPINVSTISFAPSNFSDSWGTQDPRMVYNSQDSFYYMMYTAYNGSSILLNLAKTKNPFERDSWVRLGPVFPQYQNSKSGAILIRDSPPHYLFWGDSDIRVAKSDNITIWKDIGEIFLSPRPDKFDSKLVESGPPPLRLSNGNYLFLYNSAQKGWPEDLKTSYHVGWVILDGKDPTKILERSSEALLSVEQSWEKGESPYSCNVPNVVFVEGAYALGEDRFKVFFGGGDATVGSAVIEVVRGSLRQK